MTCDLCDGDGWITDTFDFLAQLRSEDEQYRFMKRMGVLGAAMAGRMLCPRCRPSDEPKARTSTVTRP